MKINIKPEKLETLPLKEGIHITTRYPDKAAQILASGFFKEADKVFDLKLKLVFVNCFLDAILDIKEEAWKEGETDKKFFEKVAAMPLKRCIQVAARYPTKAMRILALIIHKELKERQGFNRNQEIDFINKFIGNFLIKK